MNASCHEEALAVAAVLRDTLPAETAEEAISATVTLVLQLMFLE
jgi:hypothetical protein